MQKLTLRQEKENDEPVEALSEEPITSSTEENEETSGGIDRFFDLNEGPPLVDIDKMLDSLSGDLGSVKTLLNVFLDDHSQDWKKFNEALANDQVCAQRIAHSLKGVSANLGATQLNEAATEVESRLKQGEKPTEHQMQQLKHALSQALDYVRSELKSDRFANVTSEF